MKRLLLLLLLPLLLIPITNAEEGVYIDCELELQGDSLTHQCQANIETVDDPQPTIYVRYPNMTQNDIDMTNYALESESSYDITLTETTETSQNLTYTFTPEILNNGEYTFTFTAQDTEFDNTIEGEATFTIEAFAFDIWVNRPTPTYIEQPTFGVSSTNTFNYFIETEQDFPATCVYARDDIPINVTDEDDLRNNYENLRATNRFTQSINNPNINYIENLTTDNTEIFGTTYDTTADDINRFQVICKDENNRYSYAKLGAGILTEQPSLSIQAEPSTLTDASNPWSEITAETNHRTLCEFENTDYPENFKADVQQDRRTTVSGITNYTTTHQDRFSGLANDYTYRFNATCSNLANLETTEQVSIETDYLQGLTIDIVEPTSYPQTATPNLTVRLTETRSCQYSINGEIQGTLDNFQVVGENFEDTTPIDLSEGTNNITVDCDGLTETKEVIYDNTAPSPPQIESNQYSCNLFSINPTFQANDTQAGIEYYNYTATAGNNYSLQDTTTTGTPSITITPELEGQTLDLSVTAVDATGNEGNPATTSIQITNESITECDTQPPTAYLNETDDLNRERTIYELICEDNNDCRQEFNYSIHEGGPEGKDRCTFNQVRDLQNKFRITNTSLVCYRIQDVAGNTYEDYTLITPGYSKAIGDTCQDDNECQSNYCDDNNQCQEASCTDNITNGWETDTDCGGGSQSGCPKCEQGQSCLTDTDCTTGVCNDNICVEPQCYNEEQNCGGRGCQKCEIGQACDAPSHCASGVCEDGTCVEEEQEPGGGEEGPPGGEEKGSDQFSLTGLILSITGLIFILTGGGLIAYSEYYLKNQKQDFKPGAVAGAKRRRTPKKKRQQPRQRQNKPNPKVKRRKKKADLQSKRQKRKQLLDEFDVSNDQDKSLKEKIQEKRQDTEQKEEVEEQTKETDNENASTSDEDDEGSEDNPLEQLKEFNENNEKSTDRN